MELALSLWVVFHLFCWLRLRTRSFKYLLRSSVIMPVHDFRNLKIDTIHRAVDSNIVTMGIFKITFTTPPLMISLDVAFRIATAKCILEQRAYQDFVPCY